MAQQGQAFRVYLADLTTHPSKISVCVRVVRKWIFNGNQPGAAASYIGLVLADEKGDSIYAQIHRPQIQQLDPLLQPGGTYMISKFTVRTSKTGYVPFERKFMIEFNAYSTVKEVKDPPATFPAYVYHVTPFTNVNPYGAAVTKLIDLIGILSSVQDPKPLPLPKKERVDIIRELTILNESNKELKITLWDDRATSFCLPTTSDPKDMQSVVVLFVGCQPTELHRTIQAYGGNACQWYFNPDIREAQPLYSRLKVSPVPIQRPVPMLTDAREAANSIVIEHKTIAELNKTDPYEFPKVGYKCTVTITQIHETPKWWYIGCEKCNKAPEVETVPFLCRCGWTKSTPLYKLTFQAKDGTGDARFFGYDEVSRRIIRRNIAFMLRQNRQASGLPQHFQELISRKYTFIVGVTSSSFQDPKFRTYLVKSVSVDYHEQAYIAQQLLLTQTPSQEAGPSSSPPRIAHTTDSSAVNLQIQQTGGGTPETGATPSEPVVLANETPIKGTPPPVIVDEETPAKDAHKLDGIGTSLKPKVLFAPAVSQQQEPAVQDAQVIESDKSCSPSLLRSKPIDTGESNAMVLGSGDTTREISEHGDDHIGTFSKKDTPTKSSDAAHIGVKRSAETPAELDADTSKSGLSKSRK